MYPGSSATNGRTPEHQDGSISGDGLTDLAEQFFLHPPRWKPVNRHSVEARLQRTNDALRRVLDRLEGVSGPMPTPTQKVALEAQMRELAAEVETLITRLNGHRGRNRSRHVA